MQNLAMLLALPLAFLAAPAERDITSFQPADLKIHVERVDVESWALEYSLSFAVDALDFGPPVGNFRGTWRLEPAFEWVVEEDRQRLRRRDGESFEGVDIELPVFDQIIPKQYVPFNTFSDGGATVYTGFLDAEPMREGASVEGDLSFELVPLDGEAVIVEGLRHTSGTTWTPPGGEPAFIYFGTTEPIESESLIAVVDPATPEWARDRFAAFLPQVFDYLAARFERRPSQRPSVYISARFDDGNRGRSIKGGALANQIQVRLRGEELLSAESGVDHYLFKFIAHEGAHLWQPAGAFDNSTAWIHEGGADAMALRAVEALEVWSRDDVDLAITQAGDSCAEALAKGITVATASETGSFDTLYSCGLVIAEASAGWLQKVNPELDLWSFWRRLIEDTTGEGFTTDTYLATLQDLGVSAKNCQKLRRFITESQANPRRSVDRLLAVGKKRVES